MMNMTPPATPKLFNTVNQDWNNDTGYSSPHHNHIQEPIPTMCLHSLDGAIQIPRGGGMVDGVCEKEAEVCFIFI